MIELETHLYGLEKQLLQTAVRNNAQRVGELLADEFVEFGSSGRVWNKQATIEGLRDEPPIERELTDFHAVLLAPDVALVTYRVIRREGPELPSSVTLRSSVWQFEASRWQMRFHQGTLTQSE